MFNLGTKKKKHGTIEVYSKFELQNQYAKYSIPTILHPAPSHKWYHLYSHRLYLKPEPGFFLLSNSFINGTYSNSIYPMKTKLEIKLIHVPFDFFKYYQT